MSSIFIYGPPGTGKTTLLSTMCKLGYTLRGFDMDRKMKTMANLRPLIANGYIQAKECPHPMVEEPMRIQALEATKFYPKIQPKGYMWLADELDALGKDTTDHSNEVLFIDSLTRVGEHIESLLKFFTRKPKLDFDGWAALKSNYETLFDTFYALQPNKFAHCVILAHAKDDKDEVVQIVETRPLIDGGFRDKVGSYVDEEYFTFVEAFNKNATAKFKVLTKPVDRVKQARTSRTLPTVVDADFSVIFKGEEV